MHDSGREQNAGRRKTQRQEEQGGKESHETGGSERRRSVMQECDKEAVIRLMEEDEVIRKVIEDMSKGNDVEREQVLENYLTAGHEVLGWDQGQADLMECGIRWAVEARRRGRDEERGQSTRQDQSKQGKHVRFGDEEQFEDTEVRTGRGSAGLVRGGDGRCRADETSRKGKGKGNGGKGEHGGKGEGFGSKGKRTTEDEQQRNEEKEEILRLLGTWQERETSPIVKWAWADETEVESPQQVENLVTDEDQENMRVTKNEEEEEKEAEQEEKRCRVAPNMGAGGSQPQATLDPREGRSGGTKERDTRDEMG